jgi:hypothetical protein
MKNESLSSAVDSLFIEQKAVNDMLPCIRSKAFAEAVDLLARTDRVITCASGTSSGSSSGSSGSNSNATAVTATTIKDREPELAVTEYSKYTKLSVYVKGASGYVLYRSTSKTGTYSKVDEQATTKRWDYKVMNEDLTKTYYYKVRAYKNSNGKRVYSEYSDPVKVAP